MHEDLTLEQQFEYARMQREVQNLSHEQALALLIQASRLLILKDNMIHHLAQRISSVEGDRNA